MQPEILALLGEHERSYWWARARRDLAVDVCRRYAGSGAADTRILEVGCGTGALLHDLGDVGQPFGIDPSGLALGYCQRTGLSRVGMATAETLPFAPRSFRAVVAIDVLEHLDDDQRGLREMSRVLLPGGLVVLMVPAFQFLWSDRDERLGHRRRYDQEMLGRALEHSEYRVMHLSYTNLALLPVLWLAVHSRKVLRRPTKVSTDVATLPPLANQALYAWLRAENAAALRFGLPFGTSLIAVAERR